MIAVAEYEGPDKWVDGYVDLQGTVVIITKCYPMNGDGMEG